VSTNTVVLIYVIDFCAELGSSPSASPEEEGSDAGEGAPPSKRRTPAAKRKLGAQEGSLSSLKKELAEATAAKKARLDAEQGGDEQPGTLAPQLFLLLSFLEGWCIGCVAAWARGLP